MATARLRQEPALGPPAQALASEIAPASARLHSTLERDHRVRVAVQQAVIFQSPQRLDEHYWPMPSMRQLRRTAVGAQRPKARRCLYRGPVAVRAASSA